MPIRVVSTRWLLAAPVVAGLAAATAPAAAQVPEPPAARDLSAYDGRPRLRGVRLAPDESISIDGRLDEAAWTRATPAADFIQQDPNLGQPATERTEVRVLFSGSSLYMGVICYDSEPDAITANTMQRDASFAADDRFMWTFDTYLDGRTGYLFEMNPNGAMGDSLLSAAANNVLGGAGDAARAWDGIWTGRVQVTDRGWTIEIEIPFRTLTFDPRAPAWGANFQRTIQRKNEETLWTGFARNQGVRRMSNAGLLEGIAGVSQGIGLDVQPYAIASYVDAPGRNLGSDFDPDAGLDVTYNVTPSLKGKFTINTDFAETEVDQRRVNLTRFPLFFPERRLFFLEGTTVFEFSRELGNAVVPFFSRRIGLDVDGHPQRIEYGGKLTGQVASRDVGLIHVRTASSDALPAEDFTVLRTKTNFFLQSYAGLIYTRRAESGTGAPDRHTIGADFALSTSRFRGSQNLEWSGFFVRTTGDAVASGGSAFGFRLDYPNELWDARISVRELQPGYNPAVGFVDRRNIRFYNPAIAFIPRPARHRFIRNFILETNNRILTDLDNRLLTRTLNMRFLDVYFHSGDNLRVSVTPTYERLERDFEISPGIVLPNGSAYHFTRYTALVSTASRRTVSGSAQFENGSFYSGDRRDVVLSLGLRPRAGVLMNVSHEWNRVELAEGRFTTRVFRFNGATQLSPWISFVNNVQFDSVSRILGWQSRFRWILRPGNDLYFVYLQNWLNDPVHGRLTLDRSATTKALYTHRF
jgi:hypothetical protein